jgi:hypothetical protein
MNIQTLHCPNAADLEFPATDPANAPARNAAGESPASDPVEIAVP